MVTRTRTYSHTIWTSPPIIVYTDGTEEQLRPDDEDEDYFTFGSPVGRDSVNAREDVLRAQTLLSHAGYFDMERTEGPTGWYGKPLELGIRKFQKDNGLTVDGYMEPGGETLSALEQQFGGTFAPHKPPSLKVIDDHHERRARGGPGLLETDRSRGRPFGVTTLEATKDMKPGFSMMRRPGNDRLTLLNGSAEDGRVQMASAATAAGAAGADNPARTLPQPQARPSQGGRAGLIYQTGKLLTDFPKSARDSIYSNFTGEALAEGIAGGFGKVERHETENTRLSSKILREECMKYLRSLELPDGVAREHVAGAVDDKGKEFGEKAMKDGAFQGGGGHSFADLLLRIGKTYLGFNSATERADDVWTSREFSAFQKLLHNIGDGVAKITGKKRDGETEEEYRERAREVCREGIDQALAKELERLQKEGGQQPVGGQEPATVNPEPPSP